MRDLSRRAACARATRGSAARRSAARSAPKTATPIRAWCRRPSRARRSAPVRDILERMRGRRDRARRQQLRRLRTGNALEVQAPRAAQLRRRLGQHASPRSFGDAVPMHAEPPGDGGDRAAAAASWTWSLGVEGGGIYCRQVARGNCVLGGGRGRALDADRCALRARARSASSATQAIELLPALRHAHVIRTWSGTEGYLPDRQPVIGPSRTHARPVPRLRLLPAPASRSAPRSARCWPSWSATAAAARRSTPFPSPVSPRQP